MSEQSERNKRLVLEYMAAFRTFDPDVYFPYLAEEPLYMAGMNIRRGRDPFKANTDAGRILYPEPESATNEHLGGARRRRLGGRAAEASAWTNKVEDYENLYGMFYEVVDGKIATQVEILDFRVAQDKFDLSALNRRRDPDRTSHPSDGAVSIRTAPDPCSTQRLRLCTACGVTSETLTIARWVPAPSSAGS